ncbi:hypothetical protein B0T20DRAFT_467716 [Sordaria brevicollis]|uniref:Uncharacterized protein n=1 Tax=Sordaria brevicollis TaxID=83679 RepID=A0AAE0PJJ2_SORBR|nr:hypothetical protein B0T20DRAFT_467716 [Sordaria brevicollis]
MNDERAELGRGKGVRRFSGGDERVSVERGGKGTGTGPKWVQGPGVRAQALFPSFLGECRLSLDAFGWRGWPGAKNLKVRARALPAVGLAGVVALIAFPVTKAHESTTDQQVAQARMDEFFAELPCCASK